MAFAFPHPGTVIGKHNVQASTITARNVTTSGFRATTMTDLSTITFDEESAPASPGLTKGLVYVKNTVPTKFAFIDSVGAETELVAPVIPTLSAVLGAGDSAGNNQITELSTITFEDQSAPSSPGLTKGLIYVKNTVPTKFAFINSIGAETELGAVVTPTLSAVLGAGNDASGTAISGLSTQTFAEQTTPANPGAGKGTLFVKNTVPSKLAFVDDTGVETEYGAAVTPTLSAVLVAGNSAGSTSLNMNSQNVTSIGSLTFAGDVIATATTDKVRIGVSAASSAANTVAIGQKATTSSANSIAFGGNDLAGNGAVASNSMAIAIGSNSNATGSGALASAARAIAIGAGNGATNGALASATDAIAQGSGSVASHSQAVVVGANLASRLADESVLRGLRAIRATATSSAIQTVTLITYPMLTNEISWFDAYVTERYDDNSIVAAFARKDFIFYRLGAGVVSDAGSSITTTLVGASTVTVTLGASGNNVTLTATTTTTNSRTFFASLFVRVAPLV